MFDNHDCLCYIKKSFEDTKRGMRIVNRRRAEHIMTQERDNRTSHRLQSIAHKAKDRAKRTSPITGDELIYSRRVESSCSVKGEFVN